MTRWLIMLYLAGADDLEPYMAEAMLAMERQGPPADAEVIVQLARAPLERVRRILPDRAPTDIDGDWTGVRRYRLRHGAGRTFRSERLAGPEQISVADPNALHDFVAHATEHYPADRTLLLISGHGMGFVGVTLDLTTTPTPTLMSIRSLATSLRRLARQPDLLLIDSCQMNCLEVACQLALPRPAAHWLIVPATHAPRSGLDYPALLRTLDACRDQPPGVVAARLAAALEPLASLQVLAFALDPERWRAVTRAAQGATHPVHQPMLLAAAVACVQPAPGNRLRLIVHWPTSLHFPPRYHYLYHRLQFARQSRWRRLIPAVPPRELSGERLAPLAAPSPLLFAWLRLIRTDLTDEQVAALLEHLGWSNQ